MTESLPDYSHALADPGPEPVTEETFFTHSKQLEKIMAWARARRVAPWALFFAILIRVSASTPHTVRLPGLIGGQASLNLFCAFVSRSGGGKGISDKVARMAWPTSIAIRMAGSGEGTAEMFILRGPETEDNERLTAAILSINEIDTLTGLASRQGSIILAQLKSAWMGEPLGQSNASKANSRHVEEHSYRLCVSVGCQYGHGGVIFSDTSGGTPQRFVWAPTEDPDMPYGGGPDPEPLDTSQPYWRPDEHGVTEIGYGIPEIEKTIIGSHLARQRGEADALNGHALLSRCKVAAAIAIMHQRTEVTRLDWELSGIAMGVSDRTRDSLLEYDRQASQAKIRARALSKATFDEVIDERHGTTVRNRILRLLANGPMARGELRRAMGKQHYREAFDAVLPHLEKVSQVLVVDGEKAPHYVLNSKFTGEPEFTPEKASSGGVNQEFTGEPEATITDLDSRRSHDEHPPKLSCQKWFDNHIDELRAAGHTTAESFAVYGAGLERGYSRQQLRTAASNNPTVSLIDRSGGNARWSIDGTTKAPYQSADEWVIEYLAALPEGSEVDKAAFRAAAEIAGYTWANTRRAVNVPGLIRSDRRHGSETVWIVRAAGEEGEAS